MATIIERALRRVGYVKWRPASVIHRVDAGVMGEATPITAPEIGEAAKYAGVYMASPWVYVAVNRIAEASALVQFRVFERKSAAGDAVAGEVERSEGEVATHGDVEIPDHPFEQLLRRPNPFMSRFELIEQTVGNLEIHGNAYWFLAGEPGGTPQELWPLRPDRVSIVPDPQRGVRGYIYEVDGRQIPLEAAEVVHFRRWHPSNDYYGLSALEAARLAVESDRAMSDWNRRYFGEGMAVPAGIVAIRDRVNDADFERLKREWRASYGGRERKTAFLRGAAVEWHNVGLSQHDMDFLNARRFNREEIFQIFGIPVGMFSENATEANALVGERVFIERTLWPKLVRIAEKITTDLLPFYGTGHGAGLTGRFDDIRPQDQQTRLEEIRVARDVLTVDEMRARYFQLGPIQAPPPAPEKPHPLAPSPRGGEGE
ncbi:MAG: phage portal protein, partial [Anaerolineae bacterium]|nr:phage portal protein [Anaerolineae bacterium]